MNLRLKIFFLCLLFFIISFKSDSAWVRVQSIAVHNDFFTTDYLGNIYVVNHDQIIKYSPKGEILKRYSNKRLGRIFSIDASNPLRVLVYYKEFSVVVLLDSQLSENGDSISLDQHDLEQCDLVCSSFNNGMWLFNRQNMELIRLNEGLEKVVTTGNLNRLLNFDLHPTRITEQNGFVYLNDPNTGIIIFDIYGTFFKTIPLKNINDLQILDKQILYSTKNKLHLYQMKDFTGNELDPPDTLCISVRVQKDYFYFQYRDSISVYRRSGF